MVGIIDSFRSGVPSSKQLYSKYSSDGITYKKFKKQFCDIIEIKKYILSMNNEDYLAKKDNEEEISLLKLRLKEIEDQIVKIVEKN